MHIAVCPGSFDPPTWGHLDVITKAAGLFDHVFAVVVHNPEKTPMFPVERRVGMLSAAISEAGLSNVEVGELSGGLLVDYCARVGAAALVKGVRSNLDVGYEIPMALVNRDLGGVETVFVLPNPVHAHVSSSLVRQVAALGGDASAYVPPAVARVLTAGE